MPEPTLVPSPACQLPPKAFAALEQAPLDDVLLEGAFSEMAHLPLAAVLGQGLAYAEGLLDGLQSGASAILHDRTGQSGSLAALGLMPADARFLSQLLALRDVASHHRVTPDPEAAEGLTLGEAFEGIRTNLLARRDAWSLEQGRMSPRFRVVRGDMGYLWPHAAVEGPVPVFDPEAQPDLFAVFVAIPLCAPYMMHEADCFVEPRLE